MASTPPLKTNQGGGCNKAFSRFFQREKVAEGRMREYTMKAKGIG